MIQLQQRTVLVHSRIVTVLSHLPLYASYAYCEDVIVLNPKEGELSLFIWSLYKFDICRIFILKL